MSLSPGSIATRSSSSERQPSCKELVENISKSLVSIFLKLASVNSDITLYQLYYWRTNEDVSRDPSDWNKLDDAYTILEEQSNNCQRLWMKLRATAEREALRTKAIGGSSTSGSHPLAMSPSPLEYQSEEEGKTKAGSEDQVKRMVVDQVQVKRDIVRPPTPAINPPPPRPRPRVRLCLRYVLPLSTLMSDPGSCRLYLTGCDRNSGRPNFAPTRSHTKGCEFVS